MQLGLAISNVDLEQWAPIPLAQMADEAEWAEDAGFDSAWVSDHFFMMRDSKRTAGFDPIAVLSYLAARTSRITLGVLVLCNNFRNVGQLAREVATLVDATDGRLIVGLGCGSTLEEHAAFGLPFDNRVSRLEESLIVLPKLLRGEAVTHDGRFVKLKNAVISTNGHVPPFWLAAFGPRMVNITSKYADGWAGNWNGPNPAGFREDVSRVHGALATNGRATSQFHLVADLLVLPHHSKTDEIAATARRAFEHSAPVQERVVIGTPDEVAETMRAYQAAGATDAILAPSPRQFTRFNDSSRKELAATVRKFSDQSSGTQ
jgi:alkanesulfonate monooxygenase SsuD/methylene tetrahydromethanopterin reductase-like flavin-dependent oxidoreductase (luciferase family)